MVVGVLSCKLFAFFLGNHASYKLLFNGLLKTKTKIVIDKINKRPKINVKTKVIRKKELS